MEVRKEISSLYDFEAWSGGRVTKDAIIAARKADEVWNLIEELFLEGATETEINDFLWFEGDYIREQLGLDENWQDPEDEEDEEDED